MESHWNGNECVSCYWILNQSSLMDSNGIITIFTNWETNRKKKNLDANKQIGTSQVKLCRVQGLQEVTAAVARLSMRCAASVAARILSTHCGLRTLPAFTYFIQFEYSSLL